MKIKQRKISELYGIKNLYSPNIIDAFNIFALFH